MQGEKDKTKHTHLRVCHDCDLVQHIPVLQPGQVARCYRCGSMLEKRSKNSLDRSLALAITGSILFLVSNIFPLLSLKAQGVSVESTLFSSSLELYLVGNHLLGILVFFTTIMFPLLSLSGMIFVLASVKFNYPSPGIAPIFRFLHSTEIWGMLEVFLLAIIVAGVKLGDLAEVIPGISLYSFAGLIVILSLLGTSLNPDDIWQSDQQTLQGVS